MVTPHSCSVGTEINSHELIDKYYHIVCKGRESEHRDIPVAQQVQYVDKSYSMMTMVFGKDVRRCM